jgi:cellulose synthase/poly-beta-1,6-N-acetylglucosamine synthase-like glycosyltransferase
LFFFDDDDYPKPNALERMVQTAKHTNADLVTSMFHMYRGSSPKDLKRVLARKHDWLWAFTGGSLSMAMQGNVYGGANLLVTKAAFEQINGFTEYDRVGCEDFEIYVRALTMGMHIEQIPLPLVYISQKAGSMIATMDQRLSEFRALIPLYDRYPELADGLTLLQEVVAQGGL